MQRIARLCPTVVLSVLMVSVTLASPQTSAAKPEPAGIAGKWVGTLDNGGDGHAITLDLQADGAKVTGTITILAKLDVKGEFRDGKLVLRSTVYVNGERGTNTFRATLTSDGKLDGMVEFGGRADFAWRAERAK
ncbi:MAG TPA: hypothetical protein VFO19_14590 [Vicinamibacterales bacterium]|nr:hypothetical protein [Vicinamibacterales bacterium]